MTSTCRHLALALTLALAAFPDLVSAQTPLSPSPGWARALKFLQTSRR